MATLSVLVQILVIKSRAWTGYAQNRVDGFYESLALASSESIESLASAIHVAGTILGIVIAEIFDAIYELSGVDLTAALSDVVRGDLVTGPDRLESVARASKAKFAAHVGYVLGGSKPSHKEQRCTRLSVSTKTYIMLREILNKKTP